MAEEIKQDGDWMQNKWRPAMGWMYMVVCTCDFVLFPILWALLQAAMKQPVTQWNPLTLQGAGLFHIAMGAVLGITAFGRTKEKLTGTAVNVTPTSVSAVISTPQSIAAFPTDSVSAVSSDPLSRNTRND